jgi:thiol-disulfide isomerase/thioredoxin
LKNDKRSLERKKMSRNDFQKSLIIFFGDWCPSCASFFGNFSEIVKLLTMYGVKVILVSVPSIEVLKNWRNPTVEELLSAAAKVELLGIVLVPNKVFVLALADKNTLAAAGIDGLPVVVAVKDGKEAFRAVGSDAANKLRLTDVRVLKQFMEIWEVDERESDDDAARLGDTGGKPRLVDLPDGSVCVAASLSRRRLSSALKKKSLMRGFGPRSSRRPLPSIPAIPVGTASWADVLNSRPFRPLRDSPLSSR